MSKINVIFIFISAILLAIGLFRGNNDVVLGAAVVYFTYLMIDFISFIRECQLYKKTSMPNEHEGGINSKAITFLQYLSLVFLHFSGIFMLRSDDQKLFISGLIIWPGTIVVYFVSGIILRDYLNFPVKMTYGGWKIRVPK